MDSGREHLEWSLRLVGLVLGWLVVGGCSLLFLIASAPLWCGGDLFSWLTLRAGWLVFWLVGWCGVSCFVEFFVLLFVFVKFYSAQGGCLGIRSR